MKKLLAMMALFAIVAFSQAVTTAPLDGTVIDPQGGVVVGAQVVVLNVNNGQTFNLTTDERGHWLLPAMQSGVYKVSVSMKGFRTTAITDVKMDAGTPATVTAKLEVGQVTETVDVSAGAELVQTSNATVNTTLQGRQIFELPAISRGGLDLLVSQPGVQTGTSNRYSSINGLPNGAINVTLDGLSTQDQNLKSSNGFFTFIPITQDSIEEVTLTTSAAGADATGEGAAQIKFVTKSGTNEFHGGVFWQVRNTFFNANSYFNTINWQPRNIIKLNQGGVHIGGPVFKNKLFFFTNFEGRWLPASQTYSRTVLQPSAVNGVYTYGSTGQYKSDVLALAGALGYNTKLDPIISKTLNQINGYTANGRLGVISGNFYENSLSYEVGGTDKRKYSTSRIDYNLNSKNQISLTYSYNMYRTSPDTLNGIVPVFPGTGVVVGQDNLAAGQSSNRFAGTLALRSSLTARITNELRGGLDSGTTLFGSGLGTSAIYSQWRGFIPTFGLGLTGVTSYGAESRRNSPVKQINDTLSFQIGQHMLSVGANFSQINLWSQSINSSLLPTVTFGIDGQLLDPVHNGVAGKDAFTPGAGGTMPNATSTEAGNAAALYALLTGRISGLNTSVNQSETTHTYSHAPLVSRNQQREYGIFTQDSWRALSNLTLTFGIRYEFQSPLTDLTGNYTNVDIASIWGISGVGNMFKPGTLTGVHPTYTKLEQSYQPPKMWSPSIGFAWQVPDAKGFLGLLLGNHQGASVLRGGYAINTIRYGTAIMQNMYGSNPGNSLDASIDPDNYPQNFGPAGSVLFSQATLPAFRSTVSAPSYPFAPNPTDSLNAFDPNLKMAYVQSWNLGLQRELGKNSVIEVRYTGNHGVHEWRQVQLNETNVFENGFVKEFDAALNNLLIARGGNINQSATASCIGGCNNFSNQGLPGQVNLPIMSLAFGGNAALNNSTYATYLRRNQPSALAGQITGTASRMANLTKNGYPANMFMVNPDVYSGGTYLVTNMGSSNYNALQVELRRRMTSGLMFQASYVLAHSLVNGPSASDDLYSEPITFRNVGLNKMPISFDIRQAFKVNFIYELPFGPSKHFMSGSHGFAKKAVEGWEFSGIARTQSGTPAQITGSRTGMANGNSYSDVVLQNMTTRELQSMMSIYKTTIANGSNTTQPFIGAVYNLPPALIANSNAAWETGGKDWTTLNVTAPYVGPQLAPDKFGYRVYLYGPWQNHFDVALIKRTRITEKANVEFRAQAINVLNHTNFYQGSSAPNNTLFGKTTSAYSDLSNAQDPGSRVIEFVLRVNF